MKKNVKKLLISTGVIVAALMPTIALTSCDDKNKYKLEDLKLLKQNVFTVPVEDFNKVGQLFDKTISIPQKDEITGQPNGEVITKTLKERYNAIEVEIDHWADGDTVSVINHNTQQNSKGWPGASEEGQTKQFSIRIPMIDTLESNTNNVSEREKAISLQDTHFVEKLLPAGKKVLIMGDPSENTYGRSVAYIFYDLEGDEIKYGRSFDLTMLAEGFTLARLGGALDKFRANYDKIDKPNVGSWLFPYAAYAFNQGIIKKTGFYSGKYKIKLNNQPEEIIKFTDPYDFSKEYKEHGQAMIEESASIMLPKFYRGKLNSENNIFYWLVKHSKESNK